MLLLSMHIATQLKFLFIFVREDMDIKEGGKFVTTSRYIWSKGHE